MCRRVTCSKCGKPTFAGCGLHVEQVLSDVPQGERCQCKANASAGGTKTESGAPGFFRRLLGL